MKSLITIIAALLMLVRAAGAETIGPPSLAEAQRLAGRNYPVYRIAAQDRELAAAELMGAEGGFDATLRTRAMIATGYYDSLRAESVVEKPLALRGATAFVGMKLGVGEFPIYDQRLETLDGGEVRAGVALPLWRNAPIDRRRGALARAKLAPELAELGIAQQQLELRRQVAHRYWDWVAAAQRTRIAEQLLAIATERDTALATRVRLGEIPAIERTDNARAIEQRTAQVIAARRGLEKAAIDLGVFVGERAIELWTRGGVRPELPDEPPAGAAAMEPVGRPEPRRLSLQVRQQEIEVAVAKNQLAPAIDLFASAAQDLGPAKAARPDLSAPQIEVGVMVEIPLERNLLRSRRDAAAIAVKRTRLQQELVDLRIRAEIGDAASAQGAALARIAAARREVELARATEAAELTRFDRGDSNLLLVNLREQQTAEAMLRTIDARLDYRRAFADLEAARGILD